MTEKRVSALPVSPTFRQLWDDIGSRLIESLQGDMSSKQVVAGSNPVSLSISVAESPIKGSAESHA